jgi:hypothetical protein
VAVRAAWLTSRGSSLKLLRGSLGLGLGLSLGLLMLLVLLVLLLHLLVLQLLVLLLLSVRVEQKGSGVQVSCIRRMKIPSCWVGHAGQVHALGLGVGAVEEAGVGKRGRLLAEQAQRSRRGKQRVRLRRHESPRSVSRC